jgi:hypothetical protein
MALSQDEQRMLAEIERRLAAEDPSLASCLTTFRRPGPGTVLRSPRARIIGSLFTVLLVAMVSLMVYAMIPFRTHLGRPATPATSAPVTTSTLAATSGQPNRTQQSSAGSTAGTKSAASQSAVADQSATGSQGAASRSSASAATGKTQQGKAKPTNSATMFPDTSP